MTVSTLNGFILAGLAASPGTARGRVRKLGSVGSIDCCEEGDIIVARHATPALFPALVKAQAIVAETGGRACHLAILARELNKPCVTGVKGAFAILVDGLDILVDGYDGTVEVLTSSNHAIQPDFDSTQPTKQADSESTPILNFGHFSPTWERLSASFTLDVSIQIAALVYCPAVIGMRAMPGLTIADGVASINHAWLKSFASELVARVEDDRLDFSEIRREIAQLLTYPGSDRRAARDQYISYFAAYQRIWLATITAEQLVSRYYSQMTMALDMPVESRADLAAAAIAQASNFTRRMNVTSQQSRASHSDRSELRCQDALRAIASHVTEGSFSSLSRVISNVRAVLGILEDKHVTLRLLTLQLMDQSVIDEFQDCEVSALLSGEPETVVLKLGAMLSRSANELSTTDCHTGEAP